MLAENLTNILRVYIAGLGLNPFCVQKSHEFTNIKIRVFMA